MKFAIKWPANIPTSEFCHEFVQLMADKIGISFFKYGAVEQAYPLKVDAIKSLKLRLEEFERTGNLELLPDIANYAMLRFMFPKHGDFYTPNESGKSVGRVWGGRSTGTEKRTEEPR